MASIKCLICNEAIQDGNGINAHAGTFSKKSRTSEGSIPLLSDAKSKFALTPSQCTILERVLTLPSGTFKRELIRGPYCRECFTNVNNVCHCMSALENLQQSVIEFRKDFGKKMQYSILKCGGGVSDGGHFSGGSKKRKSNPTTGSDEQTSVRSSIIRYLSNSVFPTDFFPSASDNYGESSKPSKHIHEIISNMDPNGSPDTNVDAKLVLRTTNGSMPSNSNDNSANDKSIRKFPSISLKKATTVSSKKSSKSKKKSKKSKKVPATATISSPISSTKGFKCSTPDCTKAYATNEQLDDHVSLAHLNKCPRCEKTFRTQRQLNAHFPSHGRVNNANMVQCKSCYLQFSNNKSLANHHQKEHSRQSNLVIVKKTVRPRRCKICSKIVMDVSAHMKQQHPDVAEFSQPKPESVSLKIKLENEVAENRKSDSSSTSNTNNPTNGNIEEESKETKITTENFNPTQGDTEPTVESTQKKNPIKVSPKFIVPSFATLPNLPKPIQPASSTPTTSTTPSSKYQFKNLLKIGDAEKN